MIQRKQTLYLLLSGLLMLIPIYLPMMDVITNNMLLSFFSTGFQDMSGEIVFQTWVLFGLNILVVLLSLVTIFLFKNRVLQMRITVFNLILKFGFYGLGVLYYYNFHNILDSNIELGMIRPWIAIPIVCMILDYLAHRAIAIDERTVRYMYRLR